MDGGVGGPVRPVGPRLRTMSDVNGALRQLFENRGGRHPIGPSAPLAARTQRTPPTAPAAAPATAITR
jgi:hypothetical protein